MPVTLIHPTISSFCQEFYLLVPVLLSNMLMVYSVRPMYMTFSALEGHIFWVPSLDSVCILAPVATSMAIQVSFLCPSKFDLTKFHFLSISKSPNPTLYFITFHILHISFVIITVVKLYSITVMQQPENSLAYTELFPIYL